MPDVKYIFTGDSYIIERCDTADKPIVNNDNNNDNDNDNDNKLDKIENVDKSVLNNILSSPILQSFLGFGSISYSKNLSITPNTINCNSNSNTGSDSDSDNNKDNNDNDNENNYIIINGEKIDPVDYIFNPEKYKSKNQDKYSKLQIIKNDQFRNILIKNLKLADKLKTKLKNNYKEYLEFVELENKIKEQNKINEQQKKKVDIAMKHKTQKTKKKRILSFNSKINVIHDNNHDNLDNKINHNNNNIRNYSSNKIGFKNQSSEILQRPPVPKKDRPVYNIKTEEASFDRFSNRLTNLSKHEPGDISNSDKDHQKFDNTSSTPIPEPQQQFYCKSIPDQSSCSTISIFESTLDSISDLTSEETSKLVSESKSESTSSTDSNSTTNLNNDSYISFFIKYFSSVALTDMGSSILSPDSKPDPIPKDPIPKTADDSSSLHLGSKINLYKPLPPLPT
ncbi:uncharacterized protein ASCRUDRAFT_68303 [Ascoidea rubescens DSM 1968]|uniref:Uncharacterized protein n=1 Tax=Ascoidea rubescens DSM 1968 TaxID=1344418 RepID=A0A1D2VRS4_9ASCO|nr:hypothetical protein ASCRUDRAFT_68303 [Ascoidea rubescens DSM 1968]ODV64311.1 hypothetical protein ASCRUDRAFT_68303 [Ascoidea rubescens DSM 1968]